MKEFLAYLDMGIMSNVATFVATMIFRQKILDWFNGIPSHLRTGLKTIEAGVLDQVKAYEADLVAKIIPSVPQPAQPPSAPASLAAGPVLPEVLPGLVNPAT